MSENRNYDEIAQALAAPFDADDVKAKPQTVSGNRALAIFYVNARAVMDRLDDVLGIMNWKDAYEPLPDGTVLCRLSIRINGEWITKEDVGGQSEQPDPGDRRKSALSDALKRAAVKFHIGRYLYAMKPVWADYDPQKKQFTNRPLPPGTPPGEAQTPSQKQPARTTNGHAQHPEQQSKPVPPAPPKDGAELIKRLNDYDAELSQKGICAPGELVKAIHTAGIRAGYHKDMTYWDAHAIGLAVEEIKAFVTFRRQQQKTA